MSVPGYENYRDSGVEWVDQIPSHWTTEPLWALAEECDRPNAGMIENNLLSLSYGRIVRKDINDNDGLLPASFETYQIVEPDDVVWRLTDLQNDKRSLRTARVYERGIITSAYLATRPHRIGSAYFSYLLRAYDLMKVFYSMGGGLRQGMKYSDVRRLPVLVPTPAEQTAIAVFLDRETGKIDALVEAQRRLIELLKEKRQAVISHAVTKGLDPTVPMKDSGVIWLGEVPAHWKVASIKHAVGLATSGPRGWSEMLGEDGATFLQSQNIGRTMDVLLKDVARINPPTDAEAARARLQPDDVLVCITGGRTGAVAHLQALSADAYINQHVCLLRPLRGQAEGRYLAYCLFSSAGQEQLSLAMYGLKQGLGLDQVRSQRVPLPPLDEQRRAIEWLDERLTELSGLMANAEAAIDLLQERRAALISAAVTGKIDVRGLAPGQAEAA